MGCFSVQTLMTVHVCTVVSSIITSKTFYATAIIWLRVARV